VSPRSIWLGTVGLGESFGGVAHVARCSVAALTSGGANLQLQLQRIVSLLDAGNAADRGSAVPCLIQPCSSSRIRFTARILAQAVWRPDVVLFDHVDIAQCQTFLPRPLRSRYMVWVHGIEVWKPLPRRKLAALRDAELLVFNSHFTQRRFASFHGDQFPSRVVHLTADDVLPPRTTHDVSRQPWILTVGRLEPDRPKGHGQILTALPAIADAVPEVQWHVVGKGLALEDFRRQVAASPCADRIHLHGFLAGQELQQLFEQCRLFAMPSFGEGFGIVYLEAMQHGCVPVGSTLDAAPEVIGDGGVCIDVNDQHSVERQLIELLTESDEQSQQRSQRARERTEEFSQARFQANLLDAIDQMLS
jgi:phosphatidylinositol alpha-1,6-mannosyltransferase